MTAPARLPDAVAFAPASLSNLGPGFDALGLAVVGVGDHVEAWRMEEPGVTVEMAGGDPTIPTDPARNTAGRAAESVLAFARAPFGVHLRVRKGIPLGSGIGGSAASAVAGAWAANALLHAPLPKAALVGAVLDGESVAAGARHGDNVLPSLFGGLLLVSPSDPTEYRRLTLPSLPAIPLVLPHVTVLTRDARAILPATVPLAHASAQAADLAFLVNALQAGDTAAAGRFLMRDRLAEPFRAALVPPYEAIRRAALAAGAAGCALTGSGPAMFALPRDRSDEDAILAAMEAACRDAGVGVTGFLLMVDTEGARLLPPDTMLPPPL
ncbi:MAG TPA: homoserine kinase [Rhodothermales bacterium]|nr:homoserine kinase [Rhodothermales bacterium]